MKFKIIITIIIFLLSDIHNISNIKSREYIINEETNINLNVLSIDYELLYDNISIIRIKIKTTNEIYIKINFKAFFKSNDKKNRFILDCSNISRNVIICLSKRKIFLDNEKKYFFYYNKKKSGISMTIDGKDVYKDTKNISLIFHPEIENHQIVYKNNKKFYVKIDMNMVSKGLLYLTKKSKTVLNNQKNGFNKYIGLNNYIPRGGLSYRLQWTLIAYKEAIRRGYKMVDGDLLFTKDKIPVIAHDLTLETVSNGKGYLIKKNLNELEKLDFGCKFSEKYAGEKILKFEDLLKLCKERNIIIDLDLHHLNYKEFNNNMEEYIKIIIDYVERFDMINSIIFNDNRQIVFDIFVSIRKDISFSINGMNEKKNIEKIKNKYKDSKIILYNMGGLTLGKKINKDAVKFGISLGRKIKASKIDDINFANKVVSWGVNFICTFKLEPFLMKNIKEEPIIVSCNKDDKENNVSLCEIDENINLKDNEIYNIYYSTNIYNISEDIVEESIGNFKYIDTNSLKPLYYSIIDFNFTEAKIRLNISNVAKKNEIIKGIVGPAYDNVESCYQYNYLCYGNDSHILECEIDKSDDDKVIFNGKYCIYSLEGYTFNPQKIIIESNGQKSVLLLSRDFLIFLIEIILIAIAFELKSSIKKNFI